MDNNLIEIRDLFFHYQQERIVFNNLNLGLKKGEKLALSGANGAGKTTLFKLITGLYKPISGEIKIFGKQRTEEKDFYEVRAKTGLLFQDPENQLFCPTVFEDIAFGPLNLGKSRDQVKSIIKNTLELLGIEHLENRITYRLSMGEKRLVSLATILAMEPEILLLDEPTANLDRNAFQKVTKVIKNIDISMIIVSHNKDFLDDVTEREISLKDGKVF